MLIAAKRWRAEDIEDLIRVFHVLRMQFASVLGSNDNFDLDGRTQRKSRDPYRRSCGIRLGKILGVDAVHRRERTYVCQKHANTNHVREPLVSRCKQERKVGKNLLCLGLNTAFNEPARRGILCHLAAKEDVFATAEGR
jgi:hypothetical protein